MAALQAQPTGKPRPMYPWEGVCVVWTEAKEQSVHLNRSQTSEGCRMSSDKDLSDLRV